MGTSLEIRPELSRKGSADGIITNEPVTNSMTYAFPEDRAGTMTVKLSRDGEIHLVVEDDGVGCARAARIGPVKWIRVRCDNDLTFRLPCERPPKSLATVCHQKRMSGSFGLTPASRTTGGAG
jgi:hypothetical protein